MLKSSIAAPRRRSVMLCLLLLTLFALGAPHAHAQGTDDRRSAFQLFNEKKFAEAIPLLDKVTAANPSDREAWERLGIALAVTSQSIKDAGERRKQRVRARNAMLKVKELGGGGDMVDLVLAEVPPDGGDRVKKFSENEEANRAMHEGEVAFSGGRMDEAFAAYERALKHDPQIYSAPLFAGDTFLHRGQFDKAGEWYARAIKIDPDKETAYRYWGNALLRAGRGEEARDKYVEAIIAEPYNGYVWRNGLFNWASRAGVRLSHPKVEPPVNVSRLKDNKMDITVGDGGKEDDGSAAWMMYGLVRAGWQTEEFKKKFPNEKTYRHSLAEEAEAMRLVVESVKTQQKEGKIKKLDPMLVNLLKLHDEGLLEAFILLARPDEGIAHDYVAYRRANRDKLRRYLVEYVASGKEWPGANK